VFHRLCRRIWRGHRDKSYDICWQEDGKKRWQSVGRASEGMTARRAMEIRMQILTELRNPKPEVKDPLMDDVLDSYLEIQNYKRRSDSVCARWLRPTFGHLRMSELGRPAIEEFRQSLITAGRVPSTINNYLSNLSAAVNLAITMERWDGPNPLAKIPKSKNIGRGERWLTPDEADLFIGEMARRSPWWGDAAEFSINTGARLTEIFRLRAADFRPDADSIMITAKGGRREALYLNDRAKEILERRVRDEPRPDGFVFGKRAALTVRRAAKACGFVTGRTDPRRKVWFHTLRHTFATWLVQEGQHIVNVQKLLRHKNIQMTMRYAHHAPDQMKAGLDAIGRIRNRK
jgi:integrase